LVECFDLILGGNNLSKKNVVSEDFRDKNTGDYHKIGSEYVSEDPERIEELKKKGYLEAEKATENKRQVLKK
jgi:hypothetical protein